MRFIETIQIKNGRILNPDLHRERARETILYHFGVVRELPFESLITGISPELQETLKLRVLYGKDIEEYTIEPYKRRDICKIKLSEGGDIDYSYKYEDRSQLESLLLRKGDSDDVLIIKNGFVTDTSFSNVVFREGNNFYTPSTCLLNGIKRRQMIRDGLVSVRDIRVEDVIKYRECFLINAFLDCFRVEISAEGFF